MSTFESTPLMTQAQTLDPARFAENSASADSAREADLRAAAKDFEAAFIGQMLKFSGLGDALVKGGGEDVAAFTDFYIEKFAEDLADGGGFGLQDKFYQKLSLQSNGTDMNGTLNVKS